MSKDIPRTFLRSFPLEDITILSRAQGGDGRTVEAYAAVFNTSTPIRDHQGEYKEVIAPGAFKRTIDRRGNNFGVFYNHARGLHGQPSDLFSLPIGTPIEVREDGRGLVTVTRYNMNPLAEQVLESIRNGDIKGQSFSGQFITSTPAPPKFGFRRSEDGALTTVTRTEIAMKEYGPTPFPAYDEAAILGVRAALAELLTPEQMAYLLTAPTRDDGPESGSHHPTDVGPVTEDSPEDDGHSARRPKSQSQIERQQRIMGRK